MTVLNILEGVAELLKERWPEPDTAYYTDLAPKGFQRPSFLVEAGPVTQTQLGGSTLGFELEVKITAFLPVDAYHNTQVGELCQRMGEVMALFSRGWFPVGDRAPHVDSVRGDYGYDYGEVTLSVSFNERWEMGESFPLCEDIHIKIKEA